MQHFSILRREREQGNLGLPNCKLKMRERERARQPGATKLVSSLTIPGCNMLNELGRTYKFLEPVVALLCGVIRVTVLEL